jgi:hypothetical protein
MTQEKWVPLKVRTFAHQDLIKRVYNQLTKLEMMSVIPYLTKDFYSRGRGRDKERERRRENELIKCKSDSLSTREIQAKTTILCV